MHGPLSPLEIERLRRLPRISRAREHRLYALDGTRWVDCWADGGRTLLGHRPGGLGRRIKNELDRGLYAPYPSRWEGRLEQALLRLFPGYWQVRIYRHADAAVEALGLGAPPTDPLDLPGEGTGRREGAIWGRPRLPGHPRAEFLFPIIPVSGMTSVQAVLFANETGSPDASEPVSPLVLAALARACLAGEPPEPRVSDGKLSISPSSTDIWERRGPYMLFRGTDSEYETLFDVLFAEHVLIAPSRRRPSIFPDTINEKEARLVLNGGIRR